MNVDDTKNDGEQPSRAGFSDAPVMVTGANGYVASWLVRELLRMGCTVHGTVRNPDDPRKRSHLDEMAEALPGTLRLFRADLLNPGDFQAAMDGCDRVFHTASPFRMNVADPQRDLIQPAVEGTRNVLEQANRTSSVHRLVLTSSVAAIYGDNIDIQQAPGKCLTEEVWNTSSSPSHNPYSFSKVAAEREAWKIAESQSRWQLVVINPSLVLGPALNPSPTSESFSLIKRIGNGEFRMGVPHWELGTVDVRDVAVAHVRAATRESAQGRYIISGHNTSFWEIAQLLKNEFGDAWPFPRRRLPKWLVWLVGPLVDPLMTRKAISRNVGFPFCADHSKSVHDLGMQYRPLKESLVDMFGQLIETGQLPKG